MYDFRKALRRRIAGVVLALSVLLLLPAPGPGAPADSRPVRIGVLVRRSPQRCLEKWEATAEYLTKEMPGCQFVIRPLDHNQIGPAVERQEVDFVLAISSLYVGLERFYGASRIVTLKNLRIREAPSIAATS